MIDLEKMNRECWSLDCTLAEIMLPKLLWFKNCTDRHGYPSDFYDHETEESYEDEWNETLEKIVFAIAYAANDYDWYDYQADFNYNEELKQLEPTDKEEWEKFHRWRKIHYARYEEGMRLFAKYFCSLWD